MADTKAKFVGKLDADALLVFIKENIDPNAESTIETEEKKIYPNVHNRIIFFGGEEGVEKLTSGFIHFASDGEIRSLHYFHHDTLWLDKNSFERNIKQGTPELNNEVTELFSGYIQEDDCSGDWFYKVEKVK